jgi:CRISPR system Cascade subunit CasA
MSRTDTGTFNLVDQPWIPCIQRNGKVVELALHDLFAKAHELVDIAADSPMENLALYRFLLATLHRIFGPADENAWENLWLSNVFPMIEIERYLQEKYERFDLFSPQYPFCQAEDRRVRPKSVVSLKHGIGMAPSDWFNHQVITLDVELTPAEAARDLLTVLAFGFGGLSGIPSKSHTDAPCAKGVNFVIQGDTLKQTLLLNLDLYQPHQFSRRPDLPMWEVDDPFMDERTQAKGRLDYLTYPSRRIMIYLKPEGLQHNEMIVYQYRIGLGLRLADDVINPMKHYFESESSGLLPLSFDEDKQLWRNSYSLFELNPTGKRPPAIFTWLNTLIESGILKREYLFQCKALGIAKNQGRADFARQEQFPLPLSLLNDERKLAQLKAAVDSVERTSRELNRALARTSMHLHLDDPTKFNWKKRGITNPGAEKDLNQLKTTEAEVLDWIKYTGVERQFWSTLDVPFLQLMEKLGEADEDGLTAVKLWWQGQVRESAHNNFRLVLQYTNQRPRAFKAFAQGNNHLQGHLRKNYPKFEKEEQLS